MTAGFLPTPRRGATDLGGYVDTLAVSVDRLRRDLLQIGSPTASKLIFVSTPRDLPDAVAGVRTLADETAYWFTTTVDLGGDRLVCGVNTTILGSSSENCRIKSTGLTGTALITSNHSLPMRGITIEAQTALNLDGDGVTTALDWFGVNFTNCENVGIIKDYSNVIWTDCALLNSANLTINGSIGTIGFNSSIFDGRPGQTIITLPSTLTITRRFRIIYSAFVVLSGETGINVSSSASIPVEGYVLDTVNFGGGGTYTTGVAFNDNKALWVNNRGIANSAEVGYITMQGNATATVINTVGVAVKVAGTTILQSISQKFSMPQNNRLQYTGAITRDFSISIISTFTGGTNDQYGFYVAKNGTLIAESETYATANSAGRFENAVCQTLAQLAQDDYIEVWIENATDADDVTVADLSVIVKSIS